MSLMDTRNIPELLEHALEQASVLLSNEIALARAELSEKASLAARGVVMIAVGALLALPALVMILLAIASALVDAGWEPWLANLVTGAGALVFGGIVAWIGASRFSAKRMTPRATIDEIRRDRAAVREMAR